MKTLVDYGVSEADAERIAETIHALACEIGHDLAEPNHTYSISLKVHSRDEPLAESVELYRSCAGQTK